MCTYFSTTIFEMDVREDVQLHSSICVTVRFSASSVCFHKARPYKALNVIVLSIDIGAWVSAQDCAAFLRAGCGLSPTKLKEGRV